MSRYQKAVEKERKCIRNKHSNLEEDKKILKANKIYSLELV